MTGPEFEAIRNRLGLSLNGLAERTGLDKSSIWRMENGRYPIPKVVAELLYLMDKHERPKGKGAKVRTKAPKAT